MQVDAIYDNGFVKLPDDELVNTLKPAENKVPLATHGYIRDQIRAVLGLDFEQLAARAATETTKEIWHKHLEEKHLGGR